MPAVRFSPYAWAKLLWMRDHGPTEVAGYGIAQDAGDILAVNDFATVQQTAGPASAEFNDDALANFYDDQAELGLQPCQFSRVWIHTHPGTSATPSPTDVNTFAEAFGGCDWAVMVILGTEGQTTARLHLAQAPAPRLQVELETTVDYDLPFPASDRESWLAEYELNIHAEAMQGFGGMPRTADWPQTPGARQTRSAVDDAAEVAHWMAYNMH